MNKNHILSIAVAVASAMVIPSTVFATNGMIPMGFGAKAKGMGGASIALPQEASAAANNPAGMVHIGNRIDLGAELFRPDRTGEISGNAHPLLPPGAANFRAEANNDAVALIPEGGFNKMINNQTSFGVSIVGVGGMNTNYDSIVMFNGAAGPNETGVDLMQVKIIPTIAYKFNDKHSVGVGVEIGYQLFKAYGLQAFTGTNSMPTGNPGQFFDQQASSSPANVTNNGYDGALGIGFSLGWQGQINDKLTLGATYHSKNNMQEFDDYKGLFAEKGDFDMPSWFGLGLSYKVSPKLTVAFDFTRTMYSDVDAISNELVVSAPPGFPSGFNMFAPGTMLGDDKGSGFAWEDINVFKLGVAYEVNQNLVVRAGWSHGENPIDESQTFFNLLAPATIEDHFNIGATFVLANKSELTVYAYHAFNHELKGSGSIPAAFGGGEANIEMSQTAFGLAYGWNF
jgi:long-chain fatty acid transport protein